ncbi:hypothetical protein [uncultured Thiodictyon sp.]|uniref:hypothetical protein n=1 Tax=uncultured Thiodictyon sp. TaxID=1846217 RepID=UPI0025D955D3|nr:hypothetical protein [uncultured Thiodictyon sp.]
MSRQISPRAQHQVRCDHCGAVAKVLDVTDLPNDWGARVVSDIVKHFCPLCDDRRGGFETRPYARNARAPTGG